jgi:hypothetical protein
MRPDHGLWTKDQTRRLRTHFDNHRTKFQRNGAAKLEIRAMKRQNQDILPLPEEEALNNT